MGRKESNQTKALTMHSIITKATLRNKAHLGMALFVIPGYKTFFMLSSTEHENSTAHKTKYRQIKKCFALRLSNVVFIMLINVKMPTIVGIFYIYEKDNFCAQLS